MKLLIIDVVGPQRQALIQLWERPDSAFLRIHFARHLTLEPSCLRVSTKRMHKLRIGGSQESLNHGPETPLGWRAIFLVRAIIGQEMLEIHTLEFRSAVYHHVLRKTLMT